MKHEEIEYIEELISLRKCSIMIGVPYETLRRWIKERRIPYYKLGGRLKVNKHEIREWYNARKVHPLSGARDVIRTKTSSGKQEPAERPIRRHEGAATV